MTPGMTPGMTPSGMTPGMTPVGPQSDDRRITYEEEEEDEEGKEGEEKRKDGGNDEEEAEEEEPEEDVINKLASAFTPSNVGFFDNRQIINWGMSSGTTPLEMSTPSSASTGTVATPANDTNLASVATGVPMKQGDIQSQIAAWKTKLGASSPLIHNVVATANLGVSLDLKKIALTARNAEYNPRRFSAVIMRIREPKSTALVFRSGKLVVTGTRSEEEAKRAARKFGRVIMKVGYSEARFRDFKVENLVSTFTVPFPIHLENLYKNLPANMQSQYEPEVFPGLIFKAQTGTLLIFVSGRCVMIGMKTQEDIDKAFLFILPRLDTYRKK